MQAYNSTLTLVGAMANPDIVQHFKGKIGTDLYEIKVADIEHDFSSAPGGKRPGKQIHFYIGTVQKIGKTFQGFLEGLLGLCGDEKYLQLANREKIQDGLLKSAIQNDELAEIKKAYVQGLVLDLYVAKNIQAFDLFIKNKVSGEIIAYRAGKTVQQVITIFGRFLD